MSYKPLSQTVTDGQKNPISSDAVHDHVAAEIGAIPTLPSQTSQSGKFLTTDGTNPSWATVSAGANTALSNLSSVAINTALLGTLGSVSAPAYSFTGDTNTGMWSSAGDVLNFSTNGIERLRIASDGKLGINTTSPDSFLHITQQANVEILKHTWNASYIFRLRGEAVGGDYVYKFINRMDSTNYEAITLGRGIVTIGSASPNVNLNVNGIISTTSRVRGPLNNGGAPTYSFTEDTNTGIYSSGADTLNFSTGGSERLRIASDGKLGINTTSPTANVHITQPGGTLLDLTYNSAWSLRFTNEAVDGQWVRDKLIKKISGVDYVFFQLDTGGALTIGETSRNVNLTQNGNFLTSGDVSIATAGKGLKVAEGSNATMGVATLAAGTVTVNTTAVKSNSRIMLTTQVPGGTVGFVHISARTANTSFVITSSEAADTSEVAWLIINPA